MENILIPKPRSKGLSEMANERLSKILEKKFGHKHDWALRNVMNTIRKYYNDK